MLIELKDGDTVFVTTRDVNFDFPMLREIEGIKVVHVIDGRKPFDITVIRPPVPVKDVMPAEEHDGWFPMNTAPRDGQFFDAWVVDSPLGDHHISGVRFTNDVFRVHDSTPVGHYGTPTHWRYPVKGPKAC